MSPVHIIISGASSVGKSTLVDKCIEKFRHDKKLKQYKFKAMHEVARSVLKRIGITGADLMRFIKQQQIQSFVEVQEKIIVEQLKNYENEKHENYLSDRSGFDALAYVHQYFQNEFAADSLLKSDIFQSLIKQCLDALIFIVYPQQNLTAVDDQMRMVPSYVDQMNYTRCLEHWYQRAGLSYFVLADLDLDKRVEFIEEHLHGHFCWSPTQFSLPLRLPFHLTKPEVDRCYIRRLNIVDEQHLKISYERYKKNRLIEKYDPSCLNNRFLSVLFDRKLDEKLVQNILISGIFVNGEHWNFIGYSNSQLKDRSCYLYAGSVEEIQQIIDENGDFHQLKTISKRTARIGLLFSSGTPTISIDPEKVVEIDDIERNGFVFTDGCGIIRRRLAKQIVPYLTDLKKPIINLDGNERLENPFPCAYQIRYQGCKGVLMINDDDDDDRIQVRPSMKKFNGTISPCLYVCDDGYSTPKLGFLTKQFLMLLSGLEIADEVFLQKQDQFFREIESMCFDMNVALKYSLYYDRIDLIYHLLSNNIDSIQSDLRQFQKKSIESLEKLKIPISKSRLAFGVCDPYGVLKPGECYFRPTFNGRQLMFNGKVCFVAKSPSYHLGDIRVLKLTSCRELEHLFDVLVFPTQGKRPHPNEIAGSDLDGDKYLICWDEDLIPKKMSQPMNYSSTAIVNPPLKITREDILAQFSNGQKSNKSGLIDTYFNAWANFLGIRSTQCRRLAELFSAAVDAPKTGEKLRIPSELRPPKEEEGQEKRKKFVWMEMLRRVKEFREKFQNEQIRENRLEMLSKETLLNLFLERRHPRQYHFHNIQSLKEYELIITTIKWCQEQENSRQLLHQFIYLFDFSQLTIVEKQNIEMSLMIDSSHLYSILRKSRILSKELINQYELEERSLSWRLYYVSPRFFDRSLEINPEDTLQPLIYVLTNNARHERILINISIDETIIFILDLHRYALTDQSANIFHVEPGLFNVYFESKLFSIRRKFPLDFNYFLKITSKRIQIYENDERNSFIVLMFNEQEEKTTISVDLTRFDRQILRERNHPRVNKHRYDHFEIFVLSSDADRSNSYYPMIDFHDEEFNLHNYFNEQIDQYEYIEHLTEEEKQEEEKYQKEQKQIEERRSQLISQHENPPEIIDGLMEINDTEHLQKIYKSLSHDDQKSLAMKFFDYFLQLYHSILKGSIFRPSIDEQWFYEILIDNENPEALQKLLSTIKKTNEQCLNLSQPSYLPNLARIVYRFYREHSSIDPINNETLFHLTFSLLVGNDFNSNEIHLNSLIDLQPVTNSRFTFKQLCHLMRCCLMTKTVQLCSTFVDYFLSIPFENSTELPSFIIDYIQKYLSISIRTTSYEIDEIDRRAKISRDTLIQNGETLFDLRATLLIKNSSETENDDPSATFVFQHYRDEKFPSHRMNIGDAVALIDQKQLPEKSLSPLRLFYQGIGTIQSIYPRFIVKFPFFPSSLTKFNCLNRKEIFRLERLPNFVTLNRSIEAMMKIVENKEEIAIQPFLNLTEDVQIDRLQTLANDQIQRLDDEWTNDLDYLNANLNENQRLAIRRALGNRLTLIQGPPGTGKTETSAWIIYLWLKYFSHSNHPILVCAETHQAVDNLTRRLLKFQSYRLIRYAEPRTVSPDLQEWTMQRQIQLLRSEKADSNPNEKKSLFGPAKPKELREVISNCQILCMSSSGVGILDKSYLFPFILIDEASQITEPNILIPLTKITGQIVLVGDQKQLPPIIKMPEAKELLERSFFQRLLENLQIDSIMLNTQYRMHPALIEFPSNTFYNGLLKTGLTPDQRPSPGEIEFIDRNKPLMFVNVDHGIERIRASNIYNQEEAKLICQTIQILLPKHRPILSPSDIGVITPYTKQVKEIVEQLAKHQIPKGVEIRTVDGFQGREKNIILISLVRSNDQNEIGFLTNQQRMNVLLTRAKCAMIVFGNKQTLKSNDLWKQWIDSVPNVDANRFIHYCLQQSAETTKPNKPRKRRHKR